MTFSRLIVVMALCAGGCKDKQAACAEARSQARAALQEMLTKHPAGADVTQMLSDYDKNPDDGPSFMAPMSEGFSNTNEGMTAKFKFHSRLPATAGDIKEGAPAYLRYVELGVKARDLCKK
jgi:hypothetical protein